LIHIGDVTDEANILAAPVSIPVLSRQQRYYQRHREERIAYSAEYRRLHPNYKRDYDLRTRDHKRLQSHRYQLRVKHEVLGHYSDGKIVCAWCGFKDDRALSIDHIADDGAEHRLAVLGTKRHAGITFYQWLRKNHFPPGYQVLCMNCQFIKALNVKYGMNTP